MRKIKLKLLSIILLITLVTIPYNVNAASFSASATTSLEPNKTTKLNVTTTGCAGQFSVTSSNPSVVSVSAASTFVDGTTMSPEITLSSKSEGTATITIKAIDVLDQSYNEITGSKTINITVKAKETTPPSNGGSTGGSTGGTTGGGTTTTPTAPKFTDASKTVYATGNINLRASWSTSSAATKVTKGTELRLTGTSTEKVNGYVWYRVTYNGQTKYVSRDLITETKPEEKTNNANLKALVIEGVELTPAFSTDVTEYSAKLVNYKETSVKVIAEAEDEKASVKVEGNEEITLGENIILITVTAEDESKKVYTITLTNEETEGLGLSSLIIKDVEFSGFSPSKFEYEIEFKGLSQLEIEAIANQEGATVEVLGNENLVEGKNVITIIVTSADGEQIVTYQIVANKLAVEETKELNIKAILISALIALIVLTIIIILIVIYMKNNDNSNIDYIYTDNLDNKGEDSNIAKKDDTEFSNEITEKTTIDDLYENSNDDDNLKGKRGRGKHSK